MPQEFLRLLMTVGYVVMRSGVIQELPPGFDWPASRDSMRRMTCFEIASENCERPDCLLEVSPADVLQALKRVTMIGNDMSLDTGVGVCGKEGQSVPVGVGQPTLRIEGLTVGGTA